MGQCCCEPSADTQEIDGTLAFRDDEHSKDASQQAPAVMRSAAAMSPSHSSPSGTLTFESVIKDLEAAEQAVYGTAFQRFDGGNSVPYTHSGLQDFVATNTVLSIEETETELLKVGASHGDMLVTKDDFLATMREFAVSDSEVLNRWIGLCEHGDQVESSECRSGLLMFASDQLNIQTGSMTEARWEQVFDEVMAVAGPNVTMEGWTNYCKQVARIVLVLYLAQL